MLTPLQYAGMYIPYLANYIYDTPNALALDLQGIWLGSRTLFLSLLPCVRI
jgi:carboxypeptidase D